MTVLADSRIKRQIESGNLILDGDVSQAEECSYAFKPGRAFIAGDGQQEVAFIGEANAAELVIDPGKMVWIRTKEQVNLPNDIVGFWWQTNTLSRKGLMLVNMSMVEPGYCGDLACLFVNFGNQKISISKDTHIAKMVFMDIKESVDSPYLKSNTRTNYDNVLKEMSINQPSSFLQIGDMSRDLDDQKSIILSELDIVKSQVLADVGSKIRSELESAIKEFQTDAPKSIWKSYAFAAVAVIMLGLASTISGWVKDNAFESTKDIARVEAEKTLRDKVIISGNTSSSSDSGRIISELNAINKRLDKIEKK